MSIRLDDRKRCGHGRPTPCVYCAAKIRPDWFYEMMKWRAELRRKGKLRRAS